MVVLTLKRRKSQSDFRSNRVIDEAANKLTKTALIVTVMFIICLGFDLWYYVLAYNGVVPYILNSPVQVRRLKCEYRIHPCASRTQVQDVPSILAWFSGTWLY